MLSFLKNIFYKVDDELFETLEESLILADCSAATAMSLVDELKQYAKQNNIQDANEIKEHFKSQLIKILTDKSNEQIKNCQLSTVNCQLVIGVNGVGKTTSIGKLAHHYKEMGKSVLLIAADTFRAAATEQLEIWAERAGVPIVKGEQGANPSSVVFDGIKSALAKNIDVILIDTAGRLHNKKDLMDELGKIHKTINKAFQLTVDSRQSTVTDLENCGLPTVNCLLVLDGSTGQNALMQAKAFGEVVGGAALGAPRADDIRPYNVNESLLHDVGATALGRPRAMGTIAPTAHAPTHSVGARLGAPDFEEPHSPLSTVNCQLPTGAGIAGIILTKLDSTAKGGAVISIAHEQSIPVRFVGTGESITDLAPFNPHRFVDEIFANS
ncbi:MAG: signal recognition particle-docking protein FtsY [Oscillospiraceae bacterium]|nr:signal recognition particle-docking protein FtsY [Oscillospiraceae bacterium]